MANGHKYTKEQDEFIRNNFTNVSECVRKFNEKFNTQLSYSAIKTHANRKLKIVTGFRPWTDEMNTAIKEILLKFSYKQATVIFNNRFGTDFTVKQIQDHCVRSGIKRNHAAFLEQVDEIISENIGKTYEEIRKIIYERTGKEYRDYTAVCVRATNLGLSRPHRVWQTSDCRIINGEEVTFSEYVRFIGNRWHRLASELQPLALQVIRLQVGLRDKETELML
jgi:hypothetical protein